MLKRGGICYCSCGVLVQELLLEWVAIQGGGSGRRWEGNEGWRRLGGNRAQVSLTIHWRNKNHPLSPAWIWADKASHPSSQISRMGEDSLLPGVFIPIIRPNNGTKTCRGSLWCQAQLQSWIHLMLPLEILTAWCSNKSTTPAWRGTGWISYTFSISAICIRFCSHCPRIQGKQKLPCYMAETPSPLSLLSLSTSLHLPGSSEDRAPSTQSTPPSPSTR